MVKGLYDVDQDIRMNAYNMIKNEVSTSTASMTSIPRPLKFLRLHYDAIKEYQENLRQSDQKDREFKLVLNDLLAVIVMVTSSPK
jgi:26S proteasome regulatory subunit N1